MTPTSSRCVCRLEAKLTDTMEFYAGGEVGVCTMPKKLLAAFTVTEDDLDSISGFARSIEGVKIGVMIREVEDGLGKISLRTEADRFRRLRLGSWLPAQILPVGRGHGRSRSRAERKEVSKNR